jgi:zinc transport system permease protein
MLVLPVATVQQVTKSFRSTVLFASLVGFGVSVGGVTLAWYIDVVPGATIVLSAIAMFALMRIVVSVRQATFTSTGA